MARRKRKVVPLYRTHDVSRMAFAPNTSPGEMACDPRPFRPGKTEQDYMPLNERPRVKAWRSRMAKSMGPVVGLERMAA